MISVAALGVAMASCAKEARSAEEESPVTYVQVLKARIAAEDATKTYFDGATFKWKKNDNCVVRSDNANGYSTFTFTGEDTDGEATFTNASEDHIVYGQNSFAIYPANTSTEGDKYYPCEEDGSLKIPLKNSYTWSAGNVEAPMLARVESGTPLEFKHLGGCLKVTYKNVPPKAANLVVSAPIDESNSYKICSTMGSTVNWTTAGGGFDPSETPYLKAYSHSGTYKITFDISSATAAQRVSDDGITVYIPLPVGPVELAGKNVYPKLRISLTFADGTDVPGSVRTATNVQIERAKIKPMPAIKLTKYTLSTLVGSAGRAASKTAQVVGTFGESKLFAPRGMVMISDDDAVVMDQSDAVMFLDLKNKTLEKQSYNTIATEAVPWGGCYHNGVLYIVDKSQGRLYTCDDLSTKAISYSDISTGTYSPMMIDFSGSDAYVVIRDAYGLFKYAGGITGTKTKIGDFNSGSLSKVKPISFAIDDNSDFIVATADNGFKLFKVPNAGGTPEAVAGTGTKATNFTTLVDGPVANATFTANTYGLVFDGDGNLYVGDQFAIRKITFGAGGWSDAVVTTVISNGTSTPKDGVGADAGLNCVGSMVFNSDYSKLYVTDQNAGRVYVITIE